MSNVVMLVARLLAGLLLQRSGRIAENAHVALDGVILQLSRPAVRRRNRHGFSVDLRHRLPVLMPWLLAAEAGMVGRVGVIEATMPPMIGAAVVAAQPKLAPRFVSMMVGPGIPLGLVTVSGWFWLFGTIAPGAS